MKHLLSLRTTVAFCDEAVDIFVATDLEVGTRHLDEAESIDVEIYTLEELCDMIYEENSGWKNHCCNYGICGSKKRRNGKTSGFIKME